MNPNPHSPKVVYSGNEFETKKKIPTALSLAAKITAGLLAVSLAFVGVFTGVEIASNVGVNTVSPSGKSEGEKKPKPEPVKNYFTTAEAHDFYIALAENANGEEAATVPTDQAQATGIRSRNTILITETSDGKGWCTVAGKDADAKMYPASMTKVMTLLVACEHLTDDDLALVETKEIDPETKEKIKAPKVMLTVSEELYRYQANEEGSGIGLKTGDTVSVEEALKLISYKSDTIACLLLAEYLTGEEKAEDAQRVFVGWMNEKVGKMGLTNTHFANVTGLYNADHYTTCREMAAIMAYAMDNAKVYEILSAYQGWKMTIDQTAAEPTPTTVWCEWYSQRFDDNPRISTAKKTTVTVKAAKTGYVDESGFCLVSYAVSSGGKKYVQVIVGEPKGSGLDVNKHMNDVKYVYRNFAE